MAISVRTKPEYTKIESKFFSCVRCGAAMIEWTPVVKRMAGFKRQIDEDLEGVVPTLWLQCPNGHPYQKYGVVDSRTKRVVRLRNLPPELRVRAARQAAARRAAFRPGRG